MLARQTNAIAVFCGANVGIDPEFARSAYSVGAAIAALDLELVFGGAAHGLMGAVADGALDTGGRVVGFLPPISGYEHRHPRLTLAIETTTLAERKARMIERSEAFVVLPGGIGTLDEMFEVAVLAETFETISKPTFIVNLKGYYDPIFEWRRHASTSGFIKASRFEPILVSDDIALKVALASALNRRGIAS